MRGFTLIEMATVLLLFAVGAATVVPTVRRFGDRAAVVSVREEMISALLEARGRGLEVGGSSVTFFERPLAVRTEDVTGHVRERLLDSSNRVTIDLRAPADSVTLRFDALGIGRFTSRTIEIARGDARSAVIVSSYGRVRRR